MPPRGNGEREFVIRYYDGSTAQVVTIDEKPWHYVVVQKEYTPHKLKIDYKIDLDDRLREFILGSNSPDINDFEEENVNNTSLSYEELVGF